MTKEDVPYFDSLQQPLGEHNKYSSDSYNSKQPLSVKSQNVESQQFKKQLSQKEFRK